MKFFSLSYREKSKIIYEKLFFVEKYGCKLPCDITNIICEYTYNDDEDEEEYRIQICRRVVKYLKNECAFSISILDC
eukprot:UN28696